MKITAKEVAELNAKRTQGEWRAYGGGQIADTGDYDTCGIGILGEVFRDDSDKEREPIVYKDIVKDLLTEDGDEFTLEDYHFIAAAPAMANLIASQAEELERYREALEFYANKQNYWGCLGLSPQAEQVAQQALNHNSTKQGS